MWYDFETLLIDSIFVFEVMFEFRTKIYFSGFQDSFLGSDIPYLSCNWTWRPCKVDGDFKHGDGKLEINGRMFEKGIVAHANNNITFSLYGLYDEFLTFIGISQFSDDARCGVSAGDAKFRVWGDKRVLRDWEVKSFSEPPTFFTVDITDINELILETDPNGSRDCDLSTWADPRVVRKGNNKSLAICKK